jgi:uncharacterized membrane protein YtjA (UPF0391 family)
MTKSSQRLPAARHKGAQWGVGFGRRPSLMTEPISGSALASNSARYWGRGRKENFEMLYWALVFLLIAIVAGAIGFGGVAVAFAGLAKIVFFVFLVLLVVSLIARVGRGPRSLP